MSGILIHGLHRLEGEIKIQGSKNAVLPIMAASLLHRGTVTLLNVPKIQDVFCMMGILDSLGCCCCMNGNTLVIHTEHGTGNQIPEEQAGQMRSSIMLIGPLLGRCGEVIGWYPGGCSIGERPIDLHLSGLCRMGAEICCEGDQILARTEGLKGTDISLAFPSVGATENMIMAAVAARGITVLHGAAREPEIETLCRFLECMGVRIEGIGSERLTVYGGCCLKDVTFSIPGDRIVAGTYLGAALAAGGELYLDQAPGEHLLRVMDAARCMGGELEYDSSGIWIRMNHRPKAITLATDVYPGFPTDLQSVFAAIAATAEGISQIEERVFEGRFAAAKELRKLGGHIIIRGRTVCIEGRYPLTGSDLYASDLRGGAALVVAALAAQGESTIHGCGYILRGYEDICRDLSQVGAQISYRE